MKKWRRLVAIALLGMFLSFLWSRNLTAEILPVQLVQQAQEYYHQGKFERSLQLLERARTAYDREEKYLQQSQVLVLTSLAQQELNLWDLAAKNLRESLRLLSSMAPSPNKTQVLAQIWHSKGRYEFLRGNDRQALEYWRKAEKNYRQTKDNKGIAESLLDQSRVLSAMGFFSRACDRVFVALDRPDYDCDNLTPEQINNAIALVATSSLPWEREGLNLIAEYLLLKGNISNATSFIQGSQKINAQLPYFSPIAKAKILLNLADLQQRIALRNRKNNNYQVFLATAQQAIKYYRQVLEDPTLLDIPSNYSLTAQLNLLSLLIDTKQIEEGRKLVREIKLNFSPLPNKQELDFQLKFAQDLTKLKEQGSINYSWQEIAEIYLKIIKQAKDIDAFRIQSYAWGYLGILQTKKNIKLDISPQQSIQKAINLAQRINAPEIIYRWYWKLGQIYNQQGARDKAIASYQFSLNALGDLRKDISALTKELRYDFQEQIEPVYKEYANILLNSDEISPEELALALEAIESLQVAELDNYFQDPCVVFEATSINRIDPKAAAIYTLVLPDRLEVIMARSNHLSNSASQILHRHTEFIPKTELATQISLLRQYITEPDRTIEVQQISAQLYSWLIKPFAQDLTTAKIENLVFILDTSMQTIPMAVLYDGEKYLLEKYAIAITPGLRFLNLQPKADKKSFLAGGITQTLEVEQKRFSALNNVKSELDIFRANENPILVDDLFTPANLLHRINFNSASHIHLATHGQFSSNPDQTFLLMWQKLLTIKEFSKILLQRNKVATIPIDLLALSACETASGDNRAALGLAGVAVRSGALSTLATLWRVDDESTAVLMDYFYDELKNGRNKAQALRLAQMKLWQKTDKDWQVPAFWSPYVMIGNWN